jgi:hypothetical protein
MFQTLLRRSALAAVFSSAVWVRDKGIQVAVMRSWAGPEDPAIRATWWPRSWNDAVCINQDDMVEKQHQVCLMGEIYSKTVRVIIWLGEEPDVPEFNEGIQERRKIRDVLQSFLTPSPSPGFEAHHALFQNVIMSSANPEMMELMQHVIGGLTEEPAPRDNIINRTRNCVWTGDDRDISILHQASDATLDNDTIFHAFCLLRLLAMDVHPSEIGYITFELENGTSFPSKAMRALCPPAGLCRGLRTGSSPLVDVL